MEKVKIYHVWWDKHQPGKLDNIDKEQKKGLYQVYADHNVYGRNVLVYIGQTKRDIDQRLTEHVDFAETNLKNLEYYYGEILGSDDVNKNNLDMVIDEIETILLKSHYPAYNSNEIKGLIWEPEYFNTIVLNWNDYGSLLPEVSGFRFSAKYWNDWEIKTRHIR